MKKKNILLLLLITLFLFSLFACQTTPEEEDDVTQEREIYQTLVRAEEISGLTGFNNKIINKDGSLGLPTEYEGVKFEYSSRNKDIISDDGVVTQPMTWWLQSRNQQGEVVEEFSGLNKNWPIVIDVKMTYENQVRKAKLLIIVVPHPDAVAPDYLG